MGGAVSAGGWGWAWCDVEVPWGHVRPGSKRALECLVSVFHAPREIPVCLEGSSSTGTRGWMGIEWSRWRVLWGRLFCVLVLSYV